MKIKKKAFVLFFSLITGLALQAQTSKFQMTTNRTIGQSLSFTLNYGLNISVDWGDGVLKDYTTLGDSITGEVKGSTVTVYGSYITMLECSNQGLTALNTSELTDLTNLSCHNNELQTLDITKNTKLLGLNCGFNKLATLSLTGVNALTELIVNNNQLSALPLTYTKNLLTLICNDNKINSLSLTALTYLQTLWCQNNVLTALNVSKSTALQTLICYNNQISSLNITGLSALTDLWCDSNKFSELNLSTNTALQYLSADNSSIAKLMLASGFNAQSVYLNNNNLSFAGLPATTGIANYKYAPQGLLTIPATINTSIDLSTQLSSANGIPTNATFKWFDGQSSLVAGSDYTESNGTFTFKKGFNAAYCEISSTLFPELSAITTTTTTISTTSGLDDNWASSSLSIATRPGTVILISTIAQPVKIFTTTGVLVKSLDNLEGTAEISLPKGTYVVNHRKVIL